MKLINLNRRLRHCVAGVLTLWLTLAAAEVAADEGPADASELIADYINAWADFYPSEAFAYGRAESAAAFEDYSGDRVTEWLALNARVEARVKLLLLASSTLTPDREIDLRVLSAQASDELARWREDAPLAQQPQWYAEQVSQALTHLLVRDQLEPRERSNAAVLRLQGVAELCELAMTSLRGGNFMRTERAIKTLAATRAFYADGLAGLVADWPDATVGPSLDRARREAVAAISALETYLAGDILPDADRNPAIGEDAYRAKLARRSAGLSPETLLADAGAEMRDVRGLMIREAARWRAALAEADQQRLSELSDEELLAAAIAAMESDRQDNSADFLASFTELTFAAERFVDNADIATIPRPTTLIIALSPAHFSGAAVGGVYPSGPFAPNADTLFYIPSVPDTAPEVSKEGFYRSFNTHFNTMILSHEMFPGHYLQYKVAVSEAPAVRSLFPNGSYVEGWGSFVEELMLDAGWAENAPLTRLAHLRKRLENATRAYVSVQVNTAGWGEEQVVHFARDEGLLAPQFAINLWQRVVNSPMQITDYFTGYRQFLNLHAEYLSARSTDAPAPDTRPWVDTVLRTGPVPMTILGPALQRQLRLP
jgi:uncharacterized protein (DUF885 family)